MVPERVPSDAGEIFRSGELRGLVITDVSFQGTL